MFHYLLSVNNRQEREEVGMSWAVLNCFHMASRGPKARVAARFVFSVFVCVVLEDRDAVASEEGGCVVAYQTPKDVPSVGVCLRDFVMIERPLKKSFERIWEGSKYRQICGAGSHTLNSTAVLFFIPF